MIEHFQVLRPGVKGPGSSPVMEKTKESSEEIGMQVEIENGEGGEGQSSWDHEGKSRVFECDSVAFRWSRAALGSMRGEGEEKCMTGASLWKIQGLRKLSGIVHRTFGLEHQQQQTFEGYDRFPIPFSTRKSPMGACTKVS